MIACTGPSITDDLFDDYKWDDGGAYDDNYVTIADITVFQTLYNVTYTSFSDSATSAAFIQTVVDVLSGSPGSITSSSITIVGAYPSFRRRLGMSLSSGVGPAASSSTVATEVNYIIQYSSKGANNYQSAYNSITSTLSKSISSGNFQTTLQQNGMLYSTTAFATATTVVPFYEGPTIVSYPSDNSSNSAKGLSAGAAAAIALGIIALVGLVAGGIWYYSVIYKLRVDKTVSSSTVQANPGGANTYTVNPAHGSTTLSIPAVPAVPSAPGTSSPYAASNPVHSLQGNPMYAASSVSGVAYPTPSAPYYPQGVLPPAAVPVMPPRKGGYGGGDDL